MAMEVSPGAHFLEATKGSYVYLVLGEEPVLIDTGFRGQADRIVAELAAIGLRPSDIAHIALTHHDVDHVGNAQALAAATGAKIWSSAQDRPYIEGTALPSGVRRVIRTLMPPRPVSVAAAYAPGERIGALEVIPTPGHTLGHVSLRMGDVLFAGDLVTSRGGGLTRPPGLLTADAQALERSLREVGRMEFRLVCPAHGEPVVRGSLWDALVR